MKEEVRKLGREESIRVKKERADWFAESMRSKLAEYSGQSAAYIAKRLNTEGIATATGRGKWTARSVQNVQDRLDALDKVLAEERGVAALGNALLLEGLEKIDWEAYEEDREEQMSRYADKHGDLRGFSYVGGLPPVPPEKRREFKLFREECFRENLRQQRVRVEELRAGGPYTATYCHPPSSEEDRRRELSLLETSMYFDAMMDAGLYAAPPPRIKTPEEIREENEQHDAERNRERRHDRWWNKYKKVYMVKRELTYEEWRFVDAEADEYVRCIFKRPLPEGFAERRKERDRLLKEREEEISK